MFETLRIKTRIDGSEMDFLASEGGIDIKGFTYSAERMGTSGITAEVRFDRCLDRDWTLHEFVEFRGQRYSLLRRPTSYKDNTDSRYVHTLEFQSERDITLNYVYFYDCVDPDGETYDRFQSNSSKVYFHGTLEEFVGRLNDVLAYRGLLRKGGSEDYNEDFSYDFLAPSEEDGRFHVYIEEGIATEPQMFTAEDITLFEALQKAYELWEIPFYYDGDDIWFGMANNHQIEGVFRYGGDDQLLKITRSNRNEKVITLCSGYGSEENLQSYYPNPSAKGTLGLDGTGKGCLEITRQSRFSDRFNLADEMTYYYTPATERTETAPVMKYQAQGQEMKHTITFDYEKHDNFARDIIFNRTMFDASSRHENGQVADVEETTSFIDWSDLTVTDKATGKSFTVMPKVTRSNKLSVPRCEYFEEDGHYVFATIGGFNEYEDATQVTYRVSSDKLPIGSYTLSVTLRYYTVGCDRYDIYAERGEMTVESAFWAVISAIDGWYIGNTKQNLHSMGLRQISAPVSGMSVTQVVLGKVKPQPYLMPSVYRDTFGAMRFFPAVNAPYPWPWWDESGQEHTYTFGPYPLPDGEEGFYQFPNVYDKLSPREHIEKFEDIKPTIQGAMYQDREIDVIEDVFFEPGFNTVDTATDSEELLYRHFFVKLRPLGFNLFDYAADEGEMTIRMTSGVCGGCEFVIQAREMGVNEYHNPVQVDEKGMPKLGKDGRVMESDIWQPQQDDTTDNYVWVKVALDNSTYGGDKVEMGIMPSWNETTKRGQKPAGGDTFVLLHIDLPEIYIREAERRLDEAIIKFMSENNSDKFEFSLDLSRIFLAHNRKIHDALDENSVLTVEYDGIEYTPLYVSEYTYKQTEGEALPEISIQLGDIVEYKTSGLEQAISAQMKGTGNASGIVATNMRAYAKKDAEERFRALVTFNQGIRVGDFVEGESGAALSISENGETTLEVDHLVVRDGKGGGGSSEGGSDKTFEHYQGYAAADWTIVHNLDKFPSISIVIDGHVCFADIEYVDKNTVIVHLGSAMSGYAYLN